MALDVLGRFAILAILWGASFLMVLRVVDGFGWIGAVSIRSLIASALLLILAKAMRRKLDFSIGYFPFLVLGVTMVAMQLIGLSFAVPRIGTAMTAILVGAIPLFTSVIGRLMGIEHMSRYGTVGLVLGFIGIVLLVGFPSGEVTAQFVIGIVVCTVGCIAAAFASNYSKMRMSAVGSWEQVIGAFFFGGVVTAPLLIFVPFHRVPLLGDWFNIALLAALCSSLCYVIYFKLVARLGATKAISVEFLVTVVAVLIGALYLRESISFIQLLGGALVILGCTLILSLFNRHADSR
ncbi:MAG: DMT family transporter [Actinomycetes bacterium]